MMFKTSPLNVRAWDQVKLPCGRMIRVQKVVWWGSHGIVTNPERVVWVEVADAYGRGIRWNLSAQVRLINGGLFRTMAEDPFTPRGFRVHEDGRVTHTDLVDGPWFADMSGAL